MNCEYDISINDNELRIRYIYKQTRESSVFRLSDYIRIIYNNVNNMI